MAPLVHLLAMGAPPLQFAGPPGSLLPDAPPDAPPDVRLARLLEATNVSAPQSGPTSQTTVDSRQSTRTRHGSMCVQCHAAPPATLATGTHLGSFSGGR